MVRLMRLGVNWPRRQWRDVSFVFEMRDQAANPSPSLGRIQALHFDIFYWRQGNPIAVVVEGRVDVGRPVHCRSRGVGASGSVDGQRRARRRRRRHIAEAISIPGLVCEPKWIIFEARGARLVRRLMEHVNVPTPNRQSSACSVRRLSVCQSLTDLGKSKDSAGINQSPAR
jgi:hypothetical protein